MGNVYSLFKRDPKNNLAVLAIDIGGPIIGPQGRATEGAAQHIRKLVERRFGPRVHLISKCDEVTEMWRRRWFAEHRFFEESGVLNTGQTVHFCREYWEKAVICSTIGATVFIENHIPALIKATTVPYPVLFCPEKAECAVYAEYLREHVFVPGVHPREEWGKDRLVLRTETWNDELVDEIVQMKVFRHVDGWSQPPPTPLRT